MNSSNDYAQNLALNREIPILIAQIRALYEQLDKKWHLHAAQVPITFGYDTDVLGAYKQRTDDEKEHFHFSLLFIAYGVKNPLSKEDREDLYKHEYAHYMQYHMPIPKEYQWQAGIHGSAWKYCCSLIGAVPTPYYRAGESLIKHDYQKALKNPIHDKTIPMVDRHRREKQYQNTKNREVRLQVGEEVQHPKFGNGMIEKLEQTENSVRVHVKFGNEVKILDQKWLLKQRYTSQGRR